MRCLFSGACDDFLLLSEKCFVKMAGICFIGYDLLLSELFVCLFNADSHEILAKPSFLSDFIICMLFLELAYNHINST